MKIISTDKHFNLFVQSNVPAYNKMLRMLMANKGF